MTTVILLSALFFGPPAIADDANDLTQLLHEFLAGVSDAAVHDRFWAEDLVYTSSAGTRTNKAEIMSGFGESDDGEREDTGPVYAAEDVQVKVYGTTAVVAFRLVATPGDQSARSRRAGRQVLRRTIRCLHPSPIDRDVWLATSP